MLIKRFFHGVLIVLTSMLLALAIIGTEKTLQVVFPSVNDTQFTAPLEIDLFKDASKMHDIDSVQTQTFIPIGRQSLSLGFTQDVIWLRVRLPKSVSDTETPLLLTVNPPFIDEVRAYIPQADGSVSVLLAGDQVDIDTSLPRTRMASFPVKPFQGWESTPIYLKLTSRNVMMFDLSLMSFAQAEQAERQTLFGFAMLFGLVAFALFSSLFVGLMMRDAAFLFYALYLVMQLTFVSAIYGWWRFAWPIGTGDLVLAMGQLTVFLPLLLLLARLLSLAVHYPRFYRLLLVLAILLPTMGIPLIFFGWFQLPVAIAQMFIIFASISLSLMGIGLLKKEPLAPFVLLMFSVSFIGIMMRLIMQQGWVPMTLVTQYGMVFGFIWQSVTLYLMLGYRLNRLHQDKRIADARANMAEQEVSQRRLFMNMLNHELRTPMAIIDSAACNLLANQQCAETAERLRLEKMRSAIDQMRQMMQLCLDSDRLLCTVNQQQKSLSLTQFLESVLAQIAERQDAERVVYEGLDDDVRLMGDAALLRLALVNLLDNALKYSDENQDVELLVSCPTPDRVRLSVVDKGCGFDPHIELGAIRRGANVGNTQGLGMGLALVKEIIEQHQGRLFIASSSAAGSVVCLELTCMPQAALGEIY
jgi:signal transduction histidine kinase